MILLLPLQDREQPANLGYAQQHRFRLVTLTGSERPRETSRFGSVIRRCPTRRRVQRRHVFAERTREYAVRAQEFTRRPANLLRERVQQMLDQHLLGAVTRGFARGAFQKIEHRA
jgi:hypothetical protein